MPATYGLIISCGSIPLDRNISCLFVGSITYIKPSSSLDLKNVLFLVFLKNKKKKYAHLFTQEVL